MSPALEIGLSLVWFALMVIWASWLRADTPMPLWSF
jgi:hypothetical protein